MPSKSKAQFKFFKAMEADPKAAKEKGLDKKTIKDYTKMSKHKWKILQEKTPKK
jgi:hypothetical protein